LVIQTLKTAGDPQQKEKKTDHKVEGVGFGKAGFANEVWDNKPPTNAQVR